MNIVESIKNILIEQINNYRLLLELLQKEKECLININAKDVEDLSKEKDTTVLKLRLLEEERIRLIDKFSSQNKINEKINLQKLCELTGDEDFQTIRLQLLSLLQSIKELNTFNMILIDRSLNFVRRSTSFLESFGLYLENRDKAVIISREI
ncbi:MAG: flagellar export chaperone FlgN [Thermodesulfovibrionales bacterium]